MIDTDDHRDYAEERAVEADARAEHEQEQAHLDLVARLVADLLGMGTEAQADAQATLARIGDEVALRLPPNAHRVELLARQQHLAQLAGMAGTIVEDTATYDLVKLVDDVCDGYLIGHRGSLLDGALRHAVDRVRTLGRERGAL